MIISPFCRYRPYRRKANMLRFVNLCVCLSVCLSHNCRSFHSILERCRQFIYFWWSPFLRYGSEWWYNSKIKRSTQGHWEWKWKKNRFSRLSSSEVGRFRLRQTNNKVITGPFYTHRLLHFTSISGNASFWWCNYPPGPQPSGHFKAYVPVSGSSFLTSALRDHFGMCENTWLCLRLDFKFYAYHKKLQAR